MAGTPNNDSIIGTPEADSLFALPGDDTVLGLAGNDYINGNQNNDYLNGNQGDDTVRGGQGDDTVRGGKGDDTVMGDRDNDELFGDFGNDFMLGGKGNDTIFGNQDNDTISGEDGNDLIRGGQGNDSVSGGDEEDVLYGDRGNDELSGDRGDDLILGGTGEDVASGGEGNDRIFGNQDNDTLSGDDGNDTIHGGQGDDRISGDAGDDWLYGDRGIDTLNGGAGRDRFFIGSDNPNAPLSADTIEDFQVGEDSIVLRGNLTFEGLEIVAGTGNSAGSTLINDVQTGITVAIVRDIAPEQLSQNDFLEFSPTSPDPDDNTGSGGDSSGGDSSGGGSSGGDNSGGDSSGGGNPDPTNPDIDSPTAASTPADTTVSEGDATQYSFAVTYTDNIGIDFASLDVNDVRVQSPTGDLTPSSIAVDTNGDGTPRTVTYTIDAPGGTWDTGDIGTYNVFLENNQVSDTSNNAAAGGQLGTFDVNVLAVNGQADYSSEAEGVIVRLDLDEAYRTDYGIAPRIMPLGDSITQGQINNTQAEADREGYRLQLLNSLQAFGFQPDFVGSQSHGTANLSDKDHQGHPGWKINQIRNGKNDTPNSGVDNWIPAAQPDAILLMIGTNDMSGAVDNNGDHINNGAASANNLDALIDDIIGNNAFSGDLLVSSIPPIHTSAGAGILRRQFSVDTYNPLIEPSVDSKPAAEQVSFVDIGAQLNDDDLTGQPNDNGLHPNTQGYGIIAEAWYQKLLTTIATKDVLAANVDTVTGSAQDDVIVGDGAANTIDGGAGNDKITGGGGIDVLTGGAGADDFVYNATSEGGDTITDFDINVDEFLISASGFGGGLVAGNAVTFVNGTTPGGTGGTFLYDGGVLSFDVDGTGAAAPETIATLTNAPALGAGQFTVI